MQNTAYVGVTRLRYVQCTHDKGRPYYYFRRRRFPIVRLPGEPGSELFITVYTSALAATSPEQFSALRSNMKQQRRKIAVSPLATTIMEWAEKKPITLAQASMLAKRFGVPIEQIIRGRNVVDQSLQPVSKSVEEHNEPGNLDKAEKIVGVVLPANEDPAVPLNPSKETLDDPPFRVAAA
jgi:hypothetical protein